MDCGKEASAAATPSEAISEWPTTRELNDRKRAGPGLPGIGMGDVLPDIEQSTKSLRWHPDCRQTSPIPGAVLLLPAATQGLVQLDQSDQFVRLGLRQSQHS